MGPLPIAASGHNHVLTIIDCSSQWLKAIPLVSTSATACVEAFIAGWVTRFGVPYLLTSDRSPQFISELWALLLGRLDIRYRPHNCLSPTG